MVIIDFSVFNSSRLKLPKYVFTLYKFDPSYPLTRAYQLEINCRPGLRYSDHAYSHEHYGTEKDGRVVADKSWANVNFDDAVKLFCKKCTLILTDKLQDYRDFKLK